MQIELSEATRSVHEYVRQANNEGAVGVSLADLSSGMERFTDEELRLTVMMEGNSRGDVWPVAIALSKSELDRRAQVATERLAMKTTRWSVGVGGLVAIVAACVGAYLS